MNYCKRVENGYIVLIGENCGGIKISVDEYNTILEVIRNKPIPIDGYDYKLREDLTWELYELPTPEPEDEEATEEDYKSALNSLGVNVDEEG